MGAVVTAIVVGDAPEHTTVTGEVVMVAVAGDKIRNTLQKTIHYHKFPMAEDRNTYMEG